MRREFPLTSQGISLNCRVQIEAESVLRCGKAAPTNLLNGIALKRDNGYVPRISNGEKYNTENFTT